MIFFFTSKQWCLCFHIHIIFSPVFFPVYESSSQGRWSIVSDQFVLFGSCAILWWRDYFAYKALGSLRHRPQLWQPQVKFYEVLSSIFFLLQSVFDSELFTPTSIDDDVWLIELHLPACYNYCIVKESLSSLQWVGESCTCEGLLDVTCWICLVIVVYSLMVNFIC